MCIRLVRHCLKIYGLLNPLNIGTLDVALDQIILISTIRDMLAQCNRPKSNPFTLGFSYYVYTCYRSL